eukprot:352312-Chlamydomonas_euryale.AAC.27
MFRAPEWPQGRRLHRARACSGSCRCVMYAATSPAGIFRDERVGGIPEGELAAACTRGARAHLHRQRQVRHVCCQQPWHGDACDVGADSVQAGRQCRMVLCQQVMQHLGLDLCGRCGSVEVSGRALGGALPAGDATTWSRPEWDVWKCGGVRASAGRQPGGGLALPYSRPMWKWGGGEGGESLELWSYGAFPPPPFQPNLHSSTLHTFYPSPSQQCQPSFPPDIFTSW